MIRRVRTHQGIVLYRSEVLDALGIAHGFTTRIGGVSPPPRDSLDLGPPDPEADASRFTEYTTNLRRLLEAIGRPDSHVVRTTQVHGNHVHVPGTIDPTEAPPEADALVDDDPRRVLLVRSADCVPVLLADRESGAVAAIHAGWRGIVVDVPGAAIRVLRERFHVDPGSLVAAIGPCIAGERYEVGDEVAEAFETDGLRAAVDRDSYERPHVDVREAVRLRLLESGISDPAIEVSDRCSARDEDELYSYRRDGLTGRMGAVIAPRLRDGDRPVDHA